jgi:FtsP/CotA-like multicopper oxidase with cupredoxin domain
MNRASGIFRNIGRTAFFIVAIATPCLAQNSPPSSQSQATDVCVRSPEGSSVPEPEDLRSQNGVLRVDLAFRREIDSHGQTRFCYVAKEGAVAPNLRVHPGDTVILNLKNEASLPAETSHSSMNHAMTSHPQIGAANTVAADPCSGHTMNATSTNLHFHGLVIPPVCHQDETLKTSIQPSDPTFEYRFQIPKDTPPGLYWYHPHPHGFSKSQVLGGASGALIVEGVENANPLVAGLPERILVIRDQDLVNPNAEPVKTDSMPAPIVLRDAEGDAINTGTGTGKPAKDLSLNFVPVPFPNYVPALIAMRPGERQFWRVLNASAITYLDLQLLVEGKPQLLGVISMDGIPLNESGDTGHNIVWKSHLALPPAGRIEFILKAPPNGEQASFVTRTVDTGPAGENDPTRPLATIKISSNASETRSRVPLISTPRAPDPGPETLVASIAAPSVPAPNPKWLGNVAPIRERKLYFSEESENPNDANSPTKFYVTVEGQKPVQFDPNAASPNLIVHQGDVEDWIIENRTQELHAFHIHQVHFLLTEWNGIAVDEPFLRDTVNVSYWDGHSPQFPSVRLRMDFRDPRIIGTFVFHCHLLEHEDGGMMGTIRVDPISSDPRTAATTGHVISASSDDPHF